MPRPIALSAKRLIQKYGKNVTYIKESEGVYNPELAQVVRTDPINETVRVYKTQVSYKESQSPNLVGKESCVFLLSGVDLSFTPQMNDKVSDGTIYEVVMLSKVEVNDDVALWRLICARS